MPKAKMSDQVRVYKQLWGKFWSRPIPNEQPLIEVFVAAGWKLSPDEARSHDDELLTAPLNLYRS